MRDEICSDTPLAVWPLISDRELCDNTDGADWAGVRTSSHIFRGTIIQLDRGWWQCMNNFGRICKLGKTLVINNLSRL
jgi:hypothetical protein